MSAGDDRCEETMGRYSSRFGGGERHAWYTRPLNLCNTRLSAPPGCLARLDVSYSRHKGLYRPMVYCLMISNPRNEFCLVCQRAITRMIQHCAGGIRK